LNHSYLFGRESKELEPAAKLIVVSHDYAGANWHPDVWQSEFNPNLLTYAQFSGNNRTYTVFT